MQAYRLLIILISLSIPQWLGSQQMLQSNWEDYQIALDSLYLLKNKNRILPLKQLDQYSISSISIGLDEDNEFHQTLSKYINHHSTHLQYDDDLTRVMTALNTQSYENDLLIIGVQLKEELSQEIKSFLHFYSKNKKVILCAWGEADWWYDLDQELIEKLSAVVWNPIQDSVSQSLSIQTIMGAVGAKNKLKAAIPNFDIGSGLTTKANLRLGYAPPEAVGMNRDYLKEKIANIAKEGLEAEAFPGMQVLVAKDSKVIFHETYGHHTYDKNHAVKQSDIYDWASITKIMGPLPALMKLHGEGKLDLDKRWKAYFPKFKRSNKGDLRLRSILAHQAQLEAWIPYWKNTINEDGSFKAKTLKNTPSKRYPIRLTDHLFLHKKYKRKQLYKAIKDSPLRNEKGYKYSGLSFYIFPEMISQMTQKDYEQYLYQTFYQPLGAKSVMFNPLDKGIRSENIVPTERDTFFRKVQIHGIVHDEGAAMMGGVSGNAGLFGSANDLAKMAQLYLNLGTYGGERYIKKESVEEFTSCQYCEEGNRRGLGFDKPLQEYHPDNSHTARSAGNNSYGHSGYTGTFVWIDPDEQLIYIFFSNRVYPSRERRKIYELSIRPRIHQVIYDALKN